MHEFITALCALVEHCGYGVLRDEMIQDRLVIGICDAKLAEQLQIDPELTVEKAMSNVRLSEAVKQQQTVVRGQIQQSRFPSEAKIERIQKKRVFKRRRVSQVELQGQLQARWSKLGV